MYSWQCCCQYWGAPQVSQQPQHICWPHYLPDHITRPTDTARPPLNFTYYLDENNIPLPSSYLPGLQFEQSALIVHQLLNQQISSRLLVVCVQAGQAPGLWRQTRDGAERRWQGGRGRAAVLSAGKYISTISVIVYWVVSCLQLFFCSIDSWWQMN